VIDFVQPQFLTVISPATCNQSTNASTIHGGNMKQRLMIIPVVLAVVLAACGGNTVSPQNNTGDTIAPTLTSSTPANTASSVAINSNIGFVFSEKMDTASVNVTSDPNSDLGEAVWNADANTLTFDPPANLEVLSTYTLSISGKDVAGNALASTSLQFTTAGDSNPPPPADTTAPSIVSNSPENGATNAAINTNIQVTFSESMNQGSIAATVTPNVGLGAPTFKSQNSIVEFNPPSDLIGNTNYTLTISGTDLAGNALTGTTSFSFKTTTTADTTAPNTPQNLTAQASDTQIKFSWTANTEPDLKGYTLYYSNNINDLSSKVFISKPSTTITLTGLTNNKTYFYQLEAEDGAGNKSGRTTTKNSTPEDSNPPRLLATVPKNNDPNASLNTPLILFFNEPMDSARLKITGTCSGYGGLNSICIDDPTQVVFAAPTWSSDAKTVTLNIKTPLRLQHVYTFKIDATDTFGNELPTTTISFKTQLAVDIFGPTVTKIAPADPESGVMLNVPIAITFSEPMNLESLKASFKANMAVFNGRFNPLPVSSVTVDPAGTNTYFFSVPLVYTAEVVWVLSANATDLAGNKLGANKLGHFYTIKKGTMEIISTKALDGYVGCCDVGLDIYYTELSSTIKVGFGTRKLFTRDDEDAYGFLSFDFSGLPNNLFQILDSTLYLTTYRTVGTPFADYGDLRISRFNFGSTPEDKIVPAAARNRPVLGCGAESCTIAVKSETESQFNVFKMMRQNWIERTDLGNRAQFILDFKYNIVATGKDFIEYHSADSTTLSARPKLVITYLYP
jgi:methionine-rich copper-binding protein CopC